MHTVASEFLDGHLRRLQFEFDAIYFVLDDDDGKEAEVDFGVSD